MATTIRHGVSCSPSATGSDRSRWASSSEARSSLVFRSSKHEPCDGDGDGSRFRLRTIALPSPSPNRRRANWPPDWIGSGDTRTWNAWTFTRTSPARRRSPIAAAFTHTVDLTPGSSSLFAALDRSQVQRGIRRSRRDGVTIRRGDHERDLTEIFYDLHLHTRRRHGIPVQPRRFFELLWRRILEPGHGFLSLAYLGRIPIAGAVFLIGRETVTYKYNASRPEFWRERPNHALIWHAMEWACANGLRTYDFGLTHFPNRGLRDFKRRWAAHEEVLYRSVVADSALPRRSTDGLPERALGAVIRHGPLWLCRGIGELSYKHAA